ncbi:hypothetical protein [uncultured Algimonas sp.]|uniref:hypothetical protein n=1 Tax=uncultured Algimonas sp. TaxID=1547920 RepID=UPI002620729A|nr:hypothetical protein [uncultured Algimonas sp.]
MRLFKLGLLAAALTACQPPIDATVGELEPFDVTRVGQTHCVFDGENANGDGALFATRMADENDMAHVQFKGEFLKLVPRTRPDFDGGPLDITYDVVDYLKWRVRLEATPLSSGVEHTRYEGTLTLLREGSDSLATAAIIGDCGV